MVMPFSILDIGRRINAASIEAEVLAEAQTDLAEHSIDYQKNQANLDRSQDERRTLQSLALTCSPTTMPEAAVQLALAFYNVGTLLEGDPASPVNPDLKMIHRALAGVTRVIAGVAGVNLREFGETDLVYLMDQRCPVPAPSRTAR